MVNLNVGPPLSGMPTLKTLGRDSKGVGGSDSFGKTMENISIAPKSSKMDEPQRKTERETDKGDTQKPEPQKAETVKAEKGQEGQKTEVKGRDKAIKKFMDSFESEFGIPSARLVEAIANLNPEEQVKAPEETADAVVDQLGLDDKDADRAREMYASLLVDLSKAQPQVPKEAPLMMANQSFMEGIQQRSANALEKKNLMNAGLDKLNQSFWAKPNGAEGRMGAMGAGMQTSPQALSRMMMDEQMEQPDLTDAMSESSLKQQIPQGGEAMELPPHLKGQLQSDSTGNLSPAMLAALMAKQAQAKAAAQNGEETPEASDEATVGAAADKPQYDSSSMGKSDSSVGLGLGGAAAGLAKSSADDSASSFSKQSGGQESGDFAKAMAHQKANVKDAAKLTEKGDFKEALDKPLTGTEGLNASTLPKADSLQAAAGGAVAGANMRAPTTAEHDANIRQLMNQAQYLVKKGGGEVKVEMTPEGMGPIQLKLMVQDGKVNVHMQAETAEAKKTIESGLAELKTSLAAHKLSVDHIKVDVVNSTSADVATNNQPNLNSGTQRDNTQKFWNQFNDNFGSPQQQRDGFTDIADLRGYGAKRDPLTALDNSSSARSRSVEGRGRAVNVVA